VKLIIYKRGKNETICKPFLDAELVSRQKKTIIVQTETWFPQEIGVSYFVDTTIPSDALVLVEFLQNNEAKPPFFFVGTIDTSIQCKKDNKTD
jgi:hypothetical protein